MGKIVSNFFISLDGVVEAPEKWQFPYYSDEVGAVIQEGTETTDAFLMGRVLYEEWAAYWPQHGQVTAPEGEPEQEAAAFASFINRVPKYVVSNTLTDATWSNTTIVSGGSDAVAERLHGLEEATDGDITLSGSAMLVRWLLAHGLLDGLRLLVHPVVVGQGQRLFEGTPTHPLRLVGHRALGTGVMYLTYAPA